MNEEREGNPEREERLPLSLVGEGTRGVVEYTRRTIICVDEMID